MGMKWAASVVLLHACSSSRGSSRGSSSGTLNCGAAIEDSLQKESGKRVLDKHVVMQGHAQHLQHMRQLNNAVCNS